jgi:hypothetical protein
MFLQIKSPELFDEFYTWPLTIPSHWVFSGRSWFFYPSDTFECIPPGGLVAPGRACVFTGSPNVFSIIWTLGQTLVCIRGIFCREDHLDAPCWTAHVLVLLQQLLLTSGHPGKDLCLARCAWSGQPCPVCKTVLQRLYLWRLSVIHIKWINWTLLEMPLVAEETFFF